MSQVVEEARAVYRKRTSGKAVELWDDLTGTVRAVTQVSGRVAFAALDIACAPDGSTWAFAPNRKVMPTSWRLAESRGSRETVFSHRVPPKLLNPLGRRLLSLVRSGEPREFTSSGHTATLGPFHVVDARQDGVGRLIGITVNDWALVLGETPVATFGFARGAEVRPEQPGPQGLGLLRQMRSVARSIGARDRALISLGAEHALEPAEALVLLLLFEALTDVS